MEPSRYLDEVKSFAAAVDAELRAARPQNTSNLRAIRRKYSRQFKQADPEFILDLARELFKTYGQRWIAYELIRAHRGAFARIGAAELEEFGQGIDSWWTVDDFARTLAGPAWLHGQVSDALILKWAHSENFWWRRAALVSTVAWNIRSQGGPGDVPRTLAVCRLLAADHEDMVVKAMSWALRELVFHDPQAVHRFIEEHRSVLAARVKHEVQNKVTTGLKYPGEGPNETNPPASFAPDH